MSHEAAQNTQVTEYERLMAKGNEALQSNAAEQAKQAFEKALELARQMLAEDEASMLSTPKTAATGEEALAQPSMRDRVAEALKNRGRAAEALGEQEQAEQYYRQAIECEPSYWRAAANLANLMHDKQNLEAAIQYAHQALQFNPNDAILLSNLGLYLQDSGKLQEAEEAFQKATKADPHFLGGWYNYGLLLSAQQRWDAAIQMFEKVAENPPADIALDVYRRLGEVYLHLKEQSRVNEQKPPQHLTERFVQNFSQLLNLRDVGNADEFLWPEYLYFIYFQLGIASVDLERYSKAAEYFQVSLALNPQENRAYIHHALSYAYYYLERYDEAEAHIVRFLTIEPNARQPIFSLLLSLLEKKGSFSTKGELAQLLQGVDWETVQQGLQQERNVQANTSQETPSPSTPTTSATPALPMGLARMALTREQSIPPTTIPGTLGLARMALEGRPSPPQETTTSVLRSAQKAEAVPSLPQGLARLAIERIDEQ